MKLILTLTLLTALLLAPLATLLAQTRPLENYGFRPLDFDLFDRGDSFLHEHNVALAVRETTATVKRPGGKPEAVTSVNDGVIQEHRSKICQVAALGGELEFALAKPVTVHAVRVFSGDLPNNWDLPSGEASIRRFRLEGLANGSWHMLAENTQPFLGYRERKESIGPFTHHAVLTFPARQVERLRLVSLEGNDTGKRMDPPETVPVEKRYSLIREVEIFSNDPELGPVVLPLKRLIETEWSLPAYLNTASAKLVVLPRPWLKKSVEMEVAFRDESSGAAPAAPLRFTIQPEEKPQRFHVDIANWPDGEYLTTIREVRAEGDTGELRRRLIKQTIAEPQSPQEPLAVKGVSVIPVDDWYFAEKKGLEVKLHPAEQIPVIEKPLAPDRIRMDGLSLKLDPSGDLLVEVEDMDRFSLNPRRHLVRSKDGVHWQVERPAKKSAAATPFPKPDPSARPARLAAAQVSAPLPAKPAPKGLPDDNQAKWKYQDKNAPIAARPHRYYDPAKDGPVDLTKVTVRHSRHYPPVWGDIAIPPYTVWPVWQKSPDDYVILLREPLTHHIMGFAEDDLMHANTAGDGWWGGYPEISADKKTIYWMQYRMIQRNPPFRIAYDLARGMQRHVVLWSSQDGLNWKQTFTTLPAGEDEIGTQHYGGMIMNTEGGRLRLCYQWTYRAARQQMFLELAYSRDGERWRQIPGPPFSPNGPFGSWNYGFATTVGGPEVDKDGYTYRLTGRDGSTPHFGWEVLNRQMPLEEITGEYLYKRFEGLGIRQMPNWADFGSYDKMAEHIRTTAFRTVGILRYRKNGWVSLRPEGGAKGSVLTKVLTASDAVTLNARTAEGGSIRVEVLDASDTPLPAYAGDQAAVFTGDATEGRLTWSGGTLAKLPDQPLRLRITLDRAELFALNFTGTPAPAQSGVPKAKPRPAGNLHVDSVKGDDAWSGLTAARTEADGPLRSISAAVSKAQAGDVIHLAPGVYREEVKFRDKAGAPDRPIILEGHGAVISGLAPLQAAAWEPLGGGLYRSREFLFSDGILVHGAAAANEAYIKRFFLHWEGSMNRMGRCSKGHCPPLPAPAELRPGQWTYVGAEEAFYLKTAPERSLSAEKIEYPRLLNGVSITGDACADLVIRNLTVRHALNDGFSIKSAARGIRFQDVAAMECGDDGMSAHDNARIDVNGFTARGNATGITHVGASRSSNRRLCLTGNGVNLIVEDNGAHEVRDSTIGGHDGAIILRSPMAQGVSLLLHNVSIPAEPWVGTFQPPGKKEPWIALAGSGSSLTAEQVNLDPMLALPAALKGRFTNSEAFDPKKVPTLEEK